jgi:hypothetical protein
VGITYGGFFLAGHENINDAVLEFDRDLKEIFGERHADLQPKLKELLLELWLRGTKLGERIATPTDNPGSGAHPTENFGPEMRLDDATGMMRTLSEQESLSDLERKLNLLAPQVLDPSLVITQPTTHIEIEEQGWSPPYNYGKGQLWVKSDVPNSLMFTDGEGNDHVVTGAAATTPGTPATIATQVSGLYENGDDPVQSALANKGMANPWTLVPVVMDNATGQVFGVDFTSREKIITVQQTVELETYDGGHTWNILDPETEIYVGNDPYAAHVICRVDGDIKTAPDDYSVLTVYRGAGECLKTLHFTVMLPSNAKVEITYPSTAKVPF